MPTFDRKATALQILDTADAEGEIYNAAYTDAKDLLNRALEADAKKALSGFDRRGQNAFDRPLYESDFTLHRIGLQQKAIEKAKADGIVMDYAAIDALMLEWTAIAKRVANWKPLVKSGRKKLAADARKTKERTKENTGTCAVCRQNVKRETDTTFFDHGFKISEGNGHYLGFRSGTCFGCGYLPWELSPVGAVQYILRLEAQRSHIETQIVNVETCESFRMPANIPPRFFRIATMVEIGEVGFDVAKDVRRSELKRELSSVVYTIGYYTREVAGWKARPLPDAV